MRVIAGALGGRALTAPRGRATRPTSGRVREALFAALGDVEGVRVLDLFAGSGALAIEALSRGAASAVLVERAGAALVAMRQNLERCDLLARCRVLPMTVSRASRQVAAGGPYDLVLADPPYAARRAENDLRRLLGHRGVLARGARLVLEHDRRRALAPGPGLELEHERRYGDTVLSYYRAVEVRGG